MGAFVQDVRYAFRQFRRTPGFTVAAVLTLALGIGSVSALFGIVHGVLLRPLAYDVPDRIVTLWEHMEGGGTAAISEPNFHDWRERSRSFEAMALHGNPAFIGPATILGAETALRARPTPAGEDFFRVFRVAPEVGRPFSAEEREPGAAGVVKVSWSFWRNHLAADPEVVGRRLEFWGEHYEIVGVLPEGFHYPADTDLWIPAERFGENPHRTAHNWAAVGRLRDGVGVEAANLEARRIGIEMVEEHGAGSDARGPVVARLQDELVGDLRTPLLLLLGASMLVLLIACANLAGMLIGRGVARANEVAVRTALGAGRLRVIRQMLTESLVLSVLGAVSGLGVALLIGRWLLALGPASIDPSVVAVDGTVLAFALAATLATTFLAGLVPAFRVSDAGPGRSLRGGTRGSTAERSRSWSVLVCGQVALALALLVGSALLLRSFAMVLRIDPGFEAEPVLTVDLSLPESKYPADAERARYYEAVLGDLRALPGVGAAGLVQHLPLGGVSWNGSFEIEGRGQSGEMGVYAHYRVASAGYLEAMGIPVLRGRAFDGGDRAGSAAVALVNRSLAERIWPGEDPIGKRIRDLANEPAEYREEWLTVVGVVGDVRHGGLLAEVPPELYVNVLQRPARAAAAVLVVRADVPPAQLVAPVRERIAAVDADVPAAFATMSTRLQESVANRRFTLLVLSVFAAGALVLAGVGIYGVVAYTVARRRREIGVRLALGGDARRVVRWVVGRVLGLAAAGLVGGLALAAAGTRLLGGLLHGIPSFDPLSFAGAAAALLATALVAAYLPARRAARVDPMTALRAD